jgi:23S rRNA pseudouridine2605 synthase
VILTTDGYLANRLMHPSNRVVKRYQVRLDEPFPKSKLPKLIKGVIAEGEKLKVERAALLHPAGDHSAELDVWMHHGRKREIRLLFLALGYPVKRLRRYQIGALRLRNMPVRAVKPLAPKDIESLFKVPTAPLPDHGAACWATPEPAAHGDAAPARGPSPRKRQ